LEFLFMKSTSKVSTSSVAVVAYPFVTINALSDLKLLLLYGSNSPRILDVFRN
jgi:hypothetical protein